MSEETTFAVAYPGELTRFATIVVPSQKTGAQGRITAPVRPENVSQFRATF